MIFRRGDTLELYEESCNMFVVERREKGEVVARGLCCIWRCLNGGEMLRLGEMADHVVVKRAMQEMKEGAKVNK